MQRLPLLALLLAACNSPGGTSDSMGPTNLDTTASSAETNDPGGTGGTGGEGPTTTSTTTTAAPTTGEPPATTGTGSASSDTYDTTGTSATTGAGSVGLRYLDVRQKSAHNSFQRDETLLDQIVYHRVRSLELDIHHSSSKSPTIAGEWYVYHVDIVDDSSHCRRLSQCLAQIAAAAQALPEHEVITIWVDLKDGFIAGHQPVDLDALLEASFGARLLTPGELLAACPAATDLRQAVTMPDCGWPELAALRGRVLVALTGGSLVDPTSKLSTYVGADPGARAAFAAPDLGDPAALATTTAIFHNLAIADADLAAAVHTAGLVSRVWVADNANAWTTAESAGANHIATNKVNVAIDAWASTAGPGGWPFRCIEDCDAPASEPGALLSATIDSGDLWADADDAMLATWESAGDVTLTALLAAPSSHVEPFAKTCLIARASEDPAAEYLAVCRPADDQPLRVQLRASAGADSEAIELGDIEGLSSETPAFARLEREGTCVRGLASTDGLAWSKLGEHCFAAPLPLVGLAASSHDAGVLRLVYAALTASPGGPIDAAALTVSLLGQAEGTLVDGL